MRVDTDAALVGARGPAAFSLARANPLLKAAVARTAAIFVCVLVFFLSAFVGIFNDFLGVGILFIALLFAFPEAGRSSLAATIVITGVAVFAMPLLGLFYTGDPVHTAWFALFIVVARVLVAYGEPQPTEMGTVGFSPIDLLLIGLYLVVGLFFWGGEGLSQVSFFAGWALALIHLERIHAHTRSLLHRGAGLFLFAVVIGYFVAVIWEGGGRIVQLSFVLAPLLLAVHYRAFRLNAWILAGASVALTFVGRVMRFGWSNGLAGLSEDSGASGMTLTSYLWQTRDVVLHPGSIYEQWVLLFLNWFPRDLWPAKPLGIGSTFVDTVVGRTGFGMEHNLAIGFFGEHMFFLPHTWIVSVVLLAGAVILLRRAIARVSRPYRAPVIIFDVWLITLFWGGMAAFASRAWFALIPLIPYLLFIKWLDAQAAQRVKAQPASNATV